MELYRYNNPFLCNIVPFNVFRVGMINRQRKTVTYKNTEYYISDEDARVQQTRKSNITRIIGIYTVFVWFNGSDSTKCRIEVMRNNLDKTYTKMFIEANRNYVHDISVVDQIADQDLTDYLEEV